eukprot:65280-Prorocentrum_lima.AAC.1
MPFTTAGTLSVSTLARRNGMPGRVFRNMSERHAAFILAALPPTTTPPYMAPWPNTGGGIGESSPWNMSPAPLPAPLFAKPQGIGKRFGNECYMHFCPTVFALKARVSKLGLAAARLPS